MAPPPEPAEMDLPGLPWSLPTRREPIALRPTNEDGVFAVHYCAHRIGDIDLKKADDEACGLADNAARCPQGPQAQQQQQTPLP